MNNTDIVNIENQIPELIGNLGSGDELARQHARLLLEHLDQKSIPALLEALSSTDVNTRRETARVLGVICSPGTARALADMLLDQDFTVRWASMESLIRLGRHSLRPILEKFTQNFDSPWLREGVHHILRVFKDREQLTKTEIDFFNKLDKHLAVGFEKKWMHEQAWAAERALEALAKEERGDLMPS
jgi:hypothetical protein